MLRNAGESEVCQAVLTSAYSTEQQMMQMSTKSQTSETKRASDCPPDAVPLGHVGGRSFKKKKNKIKPAEAVEKCEPRGKAV